ncbi:MAG: carboxylating nicotinate-nucleotide diphosphorylase [Chloroflexi bacterium]|nr:carboxylating nicotinate-nucleotide diphosphorylase [Chloroflexota bacterium]
MSRQERIDGLLRGVDETVRRALDEDAAFNDVTTQALIEPTVRGRGAFLVKQSGILAGLPVAEAVFREVDPSVRFTARAADGQQVKRGQIVATVEGPMAALLSGERVALNFLQRLSGIATETGRYVQAVRSTKAKILDTRKTAPGLRLLEKYAVRMGGGQNHRLNLSDQVLIKDNHIAALRAQEGGLAEIVRQAQQRSPKGMTIEIEVTTAAQAREAAEAGADIVLFDNMTLGEMRGAVRAVAGRSRIEASGGMTLARVAKVAATGVDYISVGALTHSAKALDISLEIEPKR